MGFNFSTRKMSGYTKFHIQGTDYYPPIGSDVKWESELEFPLDVFLVGAGMSLKESFKTGERWGVNLGAAKSINHPSDCMKDSDWIGAPEYNLREKISFTESDAELKALFICLEGRFALATHPAFTLELLGGYEYRDFSFEIFGVRGWQGFQEKIVYFDTLQGVNVLDYQVRYHILYVGLATGLQILPKLSLEARGAYSPYVKAKDHDDHILRHKTFDGDCNGWGLKAGADLRWIVFKTSGKSNWFMGLGFDLMKIDADGAQDQSWYGDDPVSEEDDTGKKLTGIKEEVTSKQTTIHAQIGYQF